MTEIYRCRLAVRFVCAYHANSATRVSSSLPVSRPRTLSNDSVKVWVPHHLKVVTPGTLESKRRPWLVGEGCLASKSLMRAPTKSRRPKLGGIKRVWQAKGKPPAAAAAYHTSVTGEKSPFHQQPRFGGDALFHGFFQSVKDISSSRISCNLCNRRS